MPTTSTRRPRRPQRSNPKKKKNKNKRRAAAAAVVDVDELIARADAAAVASERDVATGLYGAAVEALRAAADPRLASVLARRGETRAASGDAEGAREDLREALSASEGSDDNVAARAWFHLGQTCEGEEALEAYERGAAALEARSERARSADANDETESTEIRRQLRSARCSVAELWLTDLCSAPGAEAACEAALAAATVVDRELDDGDPEVPQTLANLRLSQADRPDRVREAADAAAEAYARVEAGCVALARLVGLGPDDDDDDPGAVELGEEEEEVVAALPGYEFRVQTAKLLLECAAELRANDDDATTRGSAAFATRAVRVLGSLLAENDEIVEPWFLLGCAFEALDDGSSREAAAHYWERARDMLRAVAKGLEDEATTTTTEDDAEDLRRELEEVTARASEVEERLRNLNDPSSNTTTTTTTNVTEMEDDRMEE